MGKVSGNLVLIIAVVLVLSFPIFLFPGAAAADVTLLAEQGDHVLYFDPSSNQTYDADGNGMTVIPNPVNGTWKAWYIEPVYGTVWFACSLTISGGAVTAIGVDGSRPLGRWRIVNSTTVSSTISPGVLNVKRLGAVGDGVTDDTAALQTVFNNVGNGQTILFPEGVYKISDTLTLAARYGVKIEMHGGFRSDGSRMSDDRGIYWSTTGPQDRPMMIINTCSQIVIDGLKMDGYRRSQDGLVLDSESSSTNFMCSNMHIRSCARYGLRVNTWRGSHQYGGTQLDMVTFRASRFTDCGTSGGEADANVTVESAQSLNIVFDTCTFSVSGSDYAEYQVYMRGGSANFENCVFLDGNNTFADIYFASDCFTSAVSATKCHQEGVSLGSNYFLYVDRSGAGAVGPVLLERCGASGDVYFNAATSLQISNGALNDVSVPHSDARVVLSNLRVLGTVSLSTTHQSQVNVY